MLVGVLFWLSKVRFGSTFEIVFEEIAGLEIGAPVRLAGVKIGDVTQISIEEGRPPQSQEGTPPRPLVVVEVTLSSRDIVLPEPDRPWRKRPTEKYLYQNYRYLIAGGSLLGTKFITISTQDRLGQPLPVSDDRIVCRGGRVQGENPIVLEDVLGKLNAIAQNVTQLLDQTTTDQIRQAIAEAAGTARETRQLVQKTNRATGAGGEKLVRIVGNVEQATEGLRRLLRDNQAQVRSMLTHLAQASQRLDQSLQRGAPDLQQLLKNLAATSSSLQRLVGSNEEHFSRLVRNLTATTETLQQMLQDNEQEVRRMLASLADTSAGMERLLSQNEGQVAALLENLNGLTEELRQTVATNQANLQTFTANLAALSTSWTQEVQGNLQRTVANLDQLTGRIQDLVADNQGNLDQIITDLGQVSKNLTGISGRLQTLLEDEQWTADLQQTLKAIRSTSEEAATTMQNLRSFLTDAELQDDLRGTMRNLEQATAQSQRLLEKTNRFFSGDLLASLGQPQWQMDVLYRPEKDRFRTDLNVRLHQPGKAFWQLGWEDVTEGNRFNLQYGLAVRPHQTLRAGLYRSKLGAGWEFEASPGTEVVLDFFNPNAAQLNLRTHYRFRPGWQLTLGVEDLGDDNDLIGGIRYSPERTGTQLKTKEERAQHGSHPDTEY